MTLSPMQSEGPFIPFTKPVPVPSAAADDAPLVSVCFNAEWLPAVIGALKILARPESWVGTKAEINDTTRSAHDLLAAYAEGCGAMIQFRQATDCTLEVSLDGGATWAEIFNAEQCILRDLNSGELAPGGGAGPGALPLGNCSTYHAILPVAGQWILPTTVNTGDQITITNVKGAWSDGWLGNFWYCADGVSYIFGVCVGPETPAKSGDLDGSYPHMRLLYEVAGVYYDGYETSSNMPGGLTGEQLTFKVNDSPTLAAAGAGTVEFDVEICRATGDYHIAMGAGTATPIGSLAWHIATEIIPGYSPSEYADWVLEDPGNNCVATARWAINNMTGWSEHGPGASNGGCGSTCAGGEDHPAPDPLGYTDWSSWFAANFLATDIAFMDVKSGSHCEFDLYCTAF